MWTEGRGEGMNEKGKTGKRGKNEGGKEGTDDNRKGRNCIG